MAKKNVEVGWLGAFSYLRAHQNYGARIILCRLSLDRQKTYQSYIIANAKTNIRIVEDLKGKTFALADPNSTSGRVIPLYELKKAGLDPYKDIMSYYAGSHKDVLDDVLGGKAPAGALSSDTYHDALTTGKFHEGDLFILDVGKNIDIPAGPVVVQKDIQRYDELRIEDAFLTVAETDPAINNTLEIGGFAKAIHQDYEFLIDIAKELHIDMSSLD